MSTAIKTEEAAPDAEQRSQGSLARLGLVIYWIFALLLFLFLIVFGVQDLRRAHAVVSTIRHLGYPEYFSYLIGTGKLLAAATLAYPKTRVLREWAYAGITFELISSFASHSFVGDPWTSRVAPLVVLAIVALAYRFDPRRV